MDKYTGTAINTRYMYEHIMILHDCLEHVSEFPQWPLGISNMF